MGLDGDACGALRGQLRSLIVEACTQCMEVSSHTRRYRSIWPNCPCDIFLKDIQSFLSEEDQYTLSDIYQEESIDPHPCFLFWYVYRYYLFFLYGYILMKLGFGFANRKISWVEFPMIGKSGFVKWHSLSRRHKQYISIFLSLRVLTYCHILYLHSDTPLFPDSPHQSHFSLFV